MKKGIALLLLHIGIFFSLAIHAQVSHHSKSINKILLVVAMYQEAEPVIRALNLVPSTQNFSNLPMRLYEGKYANKDIVLITNGTDPVNKVENIGTQPAALSTYLGIEHFHPDLVISIGTAGGVVESGAKIDDVYISQNIYFYDRRSPQKGYKEYGVGSYPSPAFDRIAHELKMKKGAVCTGDSFDIAPTDMALILKYHCSVVEMEAASVAWVSMLMKTPMIGIKGVGDLLGKESEQQYADNSAHVQKKLGEKIKSFISKVE